MKALKYISTLCAVLCIMVFCTPASAQNTGVVYANANPIPEEELVGPNGEELPAQAVLPAPKDGIAPPQAAIDLMNNREYGRAAEELERFLTTARGSVCALNYLPFTFYSMLFVADPDTTKSAFYKEKMNQYSEKYLKACPNTVEAYFMQADRTADLDSVVTLMGLAIKSYPQHMVAYERRGTVLWQLERTKEACADFEKAKYASRYALEFYLTNCKELKEEDAKETTGTTSKRR